MHSIVGRTGLWQLRKKYGRPEKLTTMSEAVHIGMIANVSFGGEVSESFSVTNGVKQSCVLAPTLVSIDIAALFRRKVYACTPYESVSICL